MSHVGDMRLLVLGGGVIMLHTMVTVLEEALFRSERFRAEAGSAFMTLVFYVLTVLAYIVHSGQGHAALALEGDGCCSLLSGLSS